MASHRLPLGFSLVEVVIGILITAIVVTAIMGISLTMMTTAGKSEKATAANEAAAQILDTLKNYVTASTATASEGPSGSWHLANDSCALPNGGNPCPGGATCYALDLYCGHTVTLLLPSMLNGATMYYWVENEGLGPLPDRRPKINVTVQWSDSQ